VAVGRRRGLAWLGLFLLAFAARSIYLAELQGTLLFEVLVGDARGYDLWAREIAAGSWLGDEVFYQAPLYPYFLGAAYALFGHELLVVRLLQAALGALSCVLLVPVGRYFFDERVGWLAGLVLAVYPPAIYFDGLIQKPSLGLFWMTLSLFLAARFGERRRGSWLLAAGLALGCFSLTRENALVLIPLLALWPLLGSGDVPFPRRAAWAGAVLLGAALVLVPVGLRNRSVGDEFLLTTSQLGTNFFIGNNPQATGVYRPLRDARGGSRYERRDATLLAEADLGRALAPAEVSRYWLERGLAFVASQPGAWARLMAAKWLLVWHAREVMDTDSIEAYRDESRLLRVVAVFYVLARYRHPLLPLLALFAAAGARELWTLAQERRWRAYPAPASLMLLAALLSNFSRPPGWPPVGAEDPRVVTWFNLGVELGELGRHAEAAAQLRRVLDVYPETVLAHVTLGDALRHQDRAEAALPHYREAVRLGPGVADAHNALGVALQQRREAAAAEDSYRRALEIDAHHAYAHHNLGGLLLEGGRSAEARTHSERAVALAPEEPVLLTQLGLARLAQGELAGALRSFDASIALDPGSPGPRYQRARVLEQLGRIPAAQEAYRELLDLPANQPTPARVRSMCRLARLLSTCAEPELRDGPEALRLARRALRLRGTPDAEILEALAAAQAETGRWDGAVRDAERALALRRAAGAEAAARDLRARLARYREELPDRVPCKAPVAPLSR
jgi:tetratricopeptide (TPR) repeat protein